MTVRYPPNSFWRVLVSNWLHGSVLIAVLPHMIAAAVVGFVAAFLNDRYRDEESAQLVSERAHRMLIVPLTFLLIFRSTISYSRFWEGREALTTLVRACSELVRQACSYIEADCEKASADRRALRALGLTMLRVTRMELSDIRTDGDEGQRNIAAHCKELGGAGIEPAALTSAEVFSSKALVPVLGTRAAMVLAASRADGYIASSRQMLQMDRQVQDILQAWLGCKKIKDTPMPFPYVQMLNFFLLIFVYTLPFTTAHIFEWALPAISAIVAMALFGINAIGVEIEDPFGDDANDFELDRIIDEVAADTLSLVHHRDSQSAAGGAYQAPPPPPAMQPAAPTPGHAQWPPATSSSDLTASVSAARLLSGGTSPQMVPPPPLHSGGRPAPLTAAVPEPFHASEPAAEPGARRRSSAAAAESPGAGARAGRRKSSGGSSRPLLPRQPAP
eukprot:TRINITY_DN20672_c0_g1_i1.p1 TRINITY_DN20672_c0_g1~~TRINITY_DN20672_c0_g1_i1.p1  ORF type:complete len:471 (+),score=125.52 TRINITY_DN20672_c0_g1_i1:78-1415(+)